MNVPYRVRAFEELGRTDIDGNGSAYDEHVRSKTKLPTSPTGATIWLTGYSGAGKTTIGRAVVEALKAIDVRTRLLDADDLRDGLNAGLGFSRMDRAENVRRLGEVALLFAESGVLSVVAAISPYQDGRRRVRERHQIRAVPFFEVYVSTPLEVCEGRDPKGLYARARLGQIGHFTGISDVYEPPERPDLILVPERETVERAVSQVLRLLPLPLCEHSGQCGHIEACYCEPMREHRRKANEVNEVRPDMS